MNRSTPDIMELTGLFCDGTISPEQAARLEKLVAESADARKYVLDSFQVHCELAWEFGRGGEGAGSHSLGIVKGNGRIFTDLISTQTKEGVSLASPAIARPTRRWLYAGVAACIFAATVLVAITTLRPPRHERQLAPEFVAHLEKLNGVHWRDDTAAEVARPLPAGRRLAIDRGLAQVNFESGAEIVVQGPAEIELQSANSVALRSGSLTAEVPAKARGFEVHSPNAALIDLGTRFGIACQAGQTDVEVFSGNVVLRAAATSADQILELRLAAHEAARVSGTPGAGSMRISPIAAGGRNFAQSVDDCYPHNAPAYACPEVPQAATELIGPWHCPRGKLVPIDLSTKANWGYTQSTPDRVSNSLIELAPGPRLLAGVEFQIASRLIQLHGKLLPNQARAVNGIPVGRRVARLYILQGAQFCGPEYGVREGGLVAEYRLHFADGDQASIPVAFGKDVRDWWANGPNPVTRGQVAWAGFNPDAKHDKRYLRLYLCTWENPHPEKVLENIDFAALHETAGPFCVAITAEEPTSVSAPAHVSSSENR
jgi:hypothetical protein